MTKKLVYSRHPSTARCGVAYFAAHLAKHLEADHIQSFQGFRKCDEFYINMDVLELEEGEVQSIINFIESGNVGKTILVMHDYRFSYLEDNLIKVSDVVLNLSGEHALTEIAPEKTLELFTPSLVDEPILQLANQSDRPLSLAFGFFSPRKKTFKKYVAFYEYMLDKHPNWYHIIAASGHTGDQTADHDALSQLLNHESISVTEFMPNTILAELINAAALGVCFYPTGILSNNAAPMSFFSSGKTVITTYGDLTKPEYKDFTINGDDFSSIDFDNSDMLHDIGSKAQAHYQAHLSWPAFIEKMNAHVHTI